MPLDSGNRYLAAVEVENDGVGERWPEELLDTCAVVFATLLIGLRRNESWLVGHKEWAPTQKIDPAPIDMDAYRLRVRNAVQAIAHAKKRAPKPQLPPKRRPRPRPHGGPEPVAPTPAPDHPTGVYVVVDGDTLWRIAHEHRISVQELEDMNDLASDLIRVGDELRVPARPGASPVATPLPDPDPSIDVESLPDPEEPIEDG